MASYDSPGFHNLMPGIPDRDGSFTAPGSVPPVSPETSSPLSDRIQQGTRGDQAVIAPSGGSLVNASMVTVGPRDTLVPSEAAQFGGGPDPLTGVPATFSGDTGAGQGRTRNTHPNNMNGGR